MDDVAPSHYGLWENDGEGTAAARPPAPPIDLVRLARNSLGDQDLELELLDMFERQAARIIGQLTAARNEDFKLRAGLAHMLKGSALAVGAQRVAHSAARVEALCADPPDPAALDAALGRLAAAVVEAREAIAKLIA